MQSNAASVDAYMKIGKGCIRYAWPERVNLEALTRLLQATAMVAGRFEDRGCE